MRNWKNILQLVFCLLLIPFICVGNPGYAPDDAEYVVISDDATLTADHVLTAGDGITVTDGASTVTVAAEWKDDATSTLVPVTANDDVYVTTSNDTYAIQGDNTQATGSSVGVYGSASGGSTDAAGVKGSVSSSATATYAGYFTNSGGGTTDYGVYGAVTGTDNSDYSVYANERTYAGDWADFCDAHEKIPMTTPPAYTLRVYADGLNKSRLMAKDPSANETDLSVAHKQTWYSANGVDGTAADANMRWEYGNQPYENPGTGLSVTPCWGGTMPGSIGAAPDVDVAYAEWHWTSRAEDLGYWEVSQYQIVIILSCDIWGDKMKVSLKDQIGSSGTFEDVKVYIQDGDGGTSGTERLTALTYTPSTSWTEHVSNEQDISGFSDSTARIIIVVQGKDWEEEKDPTEQNYNLEWVSAEQWVN